MSQEYLPRACKQQTQPELNDNEGLASNWPISLLSYGLYALVSRWSPYPKCPEIARVVALRRNYSSDGTIGKYLATKDF